MAMRDHLELGAFFAPLRRWWWLLLAATLIAIAASYLYVRDQPALYEAKTTLLIGRAFEDPNPTSNELTLGQQLAITYADLAQRQPVRQQTMTVLGLEALPQYNARALPNGQLLEIAVIDTDPQRAMAVANELARQLILQSPTAPKPEEEEQQAFITQQLVSLQENIRQTEEEITAKQVKLESAIGALEISDLQDEIAALQTKLSTLQSNYAALLASSTAGATNTIEVIEPATLPSAPTTSGQAQIILVTMAIAFTLAAGTAYLLEYLDDTVRTVEDLARVGNITSLPSIPKFRQERGRKPVIAQDTPRSPVTDAFRALRTGLYAATANKPGKTLLITSAVPKEGKSTVASNLAAVLAQGEKSVLLIDADMRRPMQHKLYGVAASEGLAELLIGLGGHAWPNGSADLIKRATQKIETMRLELIVAGSDLEDAAGLLGSETMKLLLDDVAQRFDYVIIDSPPLLAVADALILSRQVEGVILVAHAGSVHRKQLEKALRSLHEVNANVVGVVLNRQKSGTNDYYAYYYRNHANQN
jgi:capsular exopolysaccharide synthesis family protein